MQENTLKKTLKRVAAVGTSVAMLGMTLTGALAADLSTYPSPFDGANTVFVVGASADNADNSAAMDIAAGLPSSAGSAFGGVTTGEAAHPATTGLTDYEKLEDPNIGVAFNATAEFGNTIDADDLEGLQDTTIDIDIDNIDDDYDVRDEIRLGGNETLGGDGTSILAAHTGLTFSADPDFKDEVFVPMLRNSWGYYYVFEDQLLAGNNLSAASATDEIEIEFLGKLFEIEGGVPLAQTAGGATTEQITVNVGQKFYLDAGDCVTVDGKDVCLISTMAGIASVSVDGVRENVAENDEEIINGLEVRVEDVSFDDGIEYDSATLFVGEDARESFSDGEEFVGEDEDDPAWRWHLVGIASLNPTVGIRWDLELDDPEESDNPLYEHPLYEGEAICLPFDYACIVFDSLQIDDYQDYEIKAGISKDLYWSVADQNARNRNVSNEKVIQFTAKGSSDDGFIATTEVGGTNVETDTIYLAVNCTGGELQAYREEQDGSDAILFDNIAQGATTGLRGAGDYGVSEQTRAHDSYNYSWDENTFQIDYRDTQMNVDLHWLMPAFAVNNDQTDIPGPGNGPAVGCNTTIAWNKLWINGTDLKNGTGIPPAYGAIIINPVTTRSENITILIETDEGLAQTTNNRWNDFTYLGGSAGDTTNALDVVYGDINLSQVVKFSGENRSTLFAVTINNWEVEASPSSDDLLPMSNIGNLAGSKLGATGTSVDISGWEEDTRTGDGVIILDPEAHQSGDSFEMRVPSDASDFKANIILRTSGAAGAGARLRSDAGVAAGGPAVLKDSEVDDLTEYNAIVVGGPCVNKFAAELLGLSFPTCGNSGNVPFGPGEAVLELKKNGTNWALLVAGWEAADTRRAGRMLKDYDKYALTGESKVVTEEDLTVGGVAAE